MRSAEAIGILCPGFFGLRDGDDLEWVRLDAQNLFDLMRVGIRALVDDWRNDASVQVQTCNRGEVRGSGAIPGTLDGEPFSFVSPVNISRTDAGPRVVALPADMIRTKA